MTLVMQNLGEFALYALIALFVQNTVFARAFGVSRLVKLVGDASVDSMIFCALLCLVQVISAPMSYFLNFLLEQPQFWYRDYVRPLGLVLCTAAAFGLVTLGVWLIRPANARESLRALPMASFNVAVLGPLLITSSQGYSFAQTMGFALGSGLGYVFAVVVVIEGQRRMQSWKVPRTFRGLPISLLYIGILALAIYGLTGHRLVV